MKIMLLIPGSPVLKEKAQGIGLPKCIVKNPMPLTQKDLAGILLANCTRMMKMKTMTVKIKAINKGKRVTCLSLLLYECELWVLTQDMTNKINSFATSCYRIMLNIKCTDRVSNDEVYSKVDTGPLVSIVIQRQLCFLGH